MGARAHNGPTCTHARKHKRPTRRMPRCVTGTPLNTGVADLRGQLLFLGVHGFSHKELWEMCVPLCAPCALSPPQPPAQPRLCLSTYVVPPPPSLRSVRPHNGSCRDGANAVPPAAPPAPSSSSCDPGRRRISQASHLAGVASLGTWDGPLPLARREAASCATRVSRPSRRRTGTR